MDLIVTSGGRQHRVRIDRRHDHYRVTVDERSYEVDAVTAGPATSSLLINGRQHEVSVHRLGDGDYSVSTPAGSGRLHVTDPLTHLALESRGSAGTGGRQAVTAYMPGRVVALLAEEGAAIEAGQGIVVLEAMKMENEIQAEHSGTLVKLHVEEGQAVEGGDLLFEIG